MLITFTLRYRIRSLIWLCKNVLEFVWAFDFQKMKTDLGMIPIILWVPSSSLLRINISFYSIAKSTPTHFTARQVNTTNFHISQTIMIKKGNYIFSFVYSVPPLIYQNRSLVCIPKFISQREHPNPSPIVTKVSVQRNHIYRWKKSNQLLDGLPIGTMGKLLWNWREGKDFSEKWNSENNLVS